MTVTADPSRPSWRRGSRIAAALVLPAFIAAVLSCGTAQGAGLRFGMYPGGVAGQLGPTPAAPKPDDPQKQLAALADLRPPGGPFVVHLYRSYLSDESDAAEELEAQKQVERYTSAGYLVEYVVRYRRDDDVDGYVRFLRGLVDRFASNPRFVGLQVANEVNFTVSKDSSDGAYAGAKDALIQGVIAAHDEAQKRGYDQLEVGFNYVYRLDPQSDQGFWDYLRDQGGPPFAEAVDWIGLDAYPGTFFPPAATSDQMGPEMVKALDLIRSYAHGAGIADSVPIHVAENGYPTGAGRSYETQKAGLEAMVGTVAANSEKYDVSDYRWFDLRDADTSSPNFQQHYGLTEDDYTPKPAYASWKSLIRKLSVRDPVPQPPTPAATRPRLRLRCYYRGVRARVTGPGVVAVTFRARGTTLTDRRAPFTRSIRLRRPRALRVVALARRADGSSVRLATRRVCK